jgi:hypothetical protein
MVGLSVSLSLLALTVPLRKVHAVYVLPLQFMPSEHSIGGSRGLRHTSALVLTGGIDVGYFYTRVQLVRSADSNFRRS